MKLRGLSPMFAASLAAVVFAAAGCGSKKSSSSTPSAAPVTPTASTPTSTTKKKAHKTTKLHAGQFCSLSKESRYMAKGFTCVGGRLKKATAATTGTKTTKTKTTPTTAITKKYKKGQICTTSLASVYAKQGFKCVNGHLK